jgi:hypothetical protein
LTQKAEITSRKDAMKARFDAIPTEKSRDILKKRRDRSKRLFSKRLLLLKQKLFQVDWNGLRDSCGSSGTSETHAGVYAEEAHRPPRGKRASGAVINHTALLGN